MESWERNDEVLTRKMYMFGINNNVCEQKVSADVLDGAESNVQAYQQAAIEDAERRISDARRMVAEAGRVLGAI